MSDKLKDQVEKLQKSVDNSSSTPIPIPKKSEDKKAIAYELAKAQRAISVAEFFEKNRHLLGFDNPVKSLLTSVKEAVDNSLDACEDADILPEVRVHIMKKSETRFKLIVEDNGPGIVKKQIAPIFGKLLYGSKFQAAGGGKQSRGQQGIGISAVVLYSQLTTGKPTIIVSKISPDSPANRFFLHIDTKTNEPEIISSEEIEWRGVEHGTRIELELEAKYVEKKASVLEYMKETAVVNPHAKFIYVDPAGQKLTFPRVTDDMPRKAKRIKPHPYGVELGVLKRMIKATKARSLKTFLTSEFDKVGSGTAEEIIKTAKLDPLIMPKLLKGEQQEALLTAMQNTKIMSPSTDCLSPIGAELLKRSLESEYDIEFSHAITRPPSVYRGNPFQIEVAIGYGGELNPEGPVKVVRFANKVPLLYQQGSCALTKATTGINWKSYGLQQSSGNLPTGPAIIIIHMASVWAPFTSEGKEAIAHYPEIIKEVKLALQECGRHLQRFVSRRQKHRMEQKKRETFKSYSEELAEAVSKLSGEDKEILLKNLLKTAESMYSMPTSKEEPEEEETPTENVSEEEEIENE